MLLVRVAKILSAASASNCRSCCGAALTWRYVEEDCVKGYAVGEGEALQQSGYLWPKPPMCPAPAAKPPNLAGLRKPAVPWKPAGP
jgi:hypothetical protein